MDEKKIEEVMELVGAYGRAIEKHASGLYKSEQGAFLVGSRFFAIEDKLRQLLGEQHG